MSLHGSDYLAAAGKVKDFVAAHPLGVSIAAAVVVAFVVGYFVHG